jgi:plasmid stabilization system protein ParE
MASRRRRVIWALGPQEALNEALEFIAEESLDGALPVLHAILDLAANLETLSERGRTVPEYDDPGIREIFVYSYRRMYRVDADLVTIIAFIHGARDFERWARQRR